MLLGFCGFLITKRMEVLGFVYIFFNKFVFTDFPLLRKVVVAFIRGSFFNFILAVDQVFRHFFSFCVKLIYLSGLKKIGMKILMLLYIYM